MSYDKEPYYLNKEEWSQSNKTKAELGENAFSNALSDFPIWCNVTYGHRQKDIDHLILTCDCLVLNECKNLKESYQMHYSWFLSHVVNRFADGLPVAQYYARSLGYSAKQVTFTLTIPCLNTDHFVHEALKGLKIKVIQTGIQLTEERNKKQWYKQWHFSIRRQFLSVFNSNSIQVSNTHLATDDESEDESLRLTSSNIQSKAITPYEMLYLSNSTQSKKDEFDSELIREVKEI